MQRLARGIIEVNHAVMGKDNFKLAAFITDVPY
jgi:hypothetical protein